MDEFDKKTRPLLARLEGGKIAEMTTPDPLQEALQAHFGFTFFRKGQKEVISKILDGQSCLAVFPTGSGKSLCYQLPALLMPGLSIIVSPLIALMKDQVSGLQRKGIMARNLDSTLTSEEVSEVLQLMRLRELKLLFVSPERFGNPKFIKQLRLLQISFLAIDEAHCISEWGHAFRPDYLKIVMIARSLGIQTILALTATATPKVSSDICESFSISPENYVRTGFDRPQLTLAVTHVSAEERDLTLLKAVLKHPQDATIIYVTRQLTAERVGTYLKKEGGLKVRSYHAGLTMELRAQIQEEFMNGSCRCIVATIAFGMGVDKSDIRYVYHYNVPKSLENYVQETGRAGRDGQPAFCHLLACREDLRVLENFIYTKKPSIHAIESLVSTCLRTRGEVALNRYELSIAHDIKTEVIETILVWLELEGLVKSRGWKYGQFEVGLDYDLQELLQEHPLEERPFLKALFQAGQSKARGQRKMRFSIAEVAFFLQVEEREVREVLLRLARDGYLTLKSRQYLMLSEATEEGLARTKSTVIKELYASFTHWETRELVRLEQVLTLIEGTQCLDQGLRQYFGEGSAPCGRCSTCKSESPPLELDTTKPQSLGEAEVELIVAVASERHASLRDPRQMAKFLCGQTSPASTRARLTTKHEHFGALESYPFLEILLHCEAVMGKS